jgi:hypothetical protein
MCYKNDVLSCPVCLCLSICLSMPPSLPLSVCPAVRLCVCPPEEVLSLCGLCPTPGHSGPEEERSWEEQLEYHQEQLEKEMQEARRMVFRLQVTKDSSHTHTHTRTRTRTRTHTHTRYCRKLKLKLLVNWNKIINKPVSKTTVILKLLYLTPKLTKINNK